MATRISRQQRLIGDFQFADNQLQRVLGEIRDAVKHLQGLVGETNQVVTLEQVQNLINNINIGGGGGISEAPEDGVLYGRKDANWAPVPTDIGDLTDTGDLLGGGGIEEAPNDGEKYVRQNEAWTALPGGVASGLKWIDYTTGFESSTLPTLLETIPDGDVYEYTYSNGTLYRLVATDGRDLFYSTFSSPTLSGLVSEKEITI